MKHSRSIRRLTVIFSFIILSAITAGCTKKIPSDSEKKYSVSIYKDPTGDLNLPDIMKMNDQFIQVPMGMVNEGFYPLNLWIRIKLHQAPQENQKLFLMPTRESALYGEYYVPDGSSWKVLKTGYSLPKADSLPRDPLTFPIPPFSDPELTVYIKFSGFFFKNFTLKLVDQEGLVSYSRTRNTIQIAYTIMMGILFLWSLYSFFLFRNLSYLWYSLAISSMWLIFIFHRGSLLAILNSKHTHELTLFLLGAFPLLVFFGGEYKRTLLRLDLVSPVMDKILQVGIYSNLAFFLLIFTAKVNVIVMATHLMSLIIHVLIFVFNLYAAYRGAWISRLAVVPSFLIVFFLGLTNLHFLKIYSVNQFAGLMILFLTPLELIYLAVIQHIQIGRLIHYYNSSETPLLMQSRPGNPKTNSPVDETQGETHDENRKTYLKKEEIDELIAKMNSLLKEEKLYLVEDIRAPQLAAAMGIKPHHLTELLNLHIGISFVNLIKQHRIMEAIHSMKENPDKKIVDLAFETGFQSRSVFNRAFKEITGLTPVEYRSGIPEKSRRHKETSI